MSVLSLFHEIKTRIRWKLVKGVAKANCPLLKNFSGEWRDKYYEMVYPRSQWIQKGLPLMSSPCHDFHIYIMLLCLHSFLPFFCSHGKIQTSLYLCCRKEKWECLCLMCVLLIIVEYGASYWDWAITYFSYDITDEWPYFIHLCS